MGGGGGGGGWGQGPRRTTPFLAGAEIKVRPINVNPKLSPQTRDTVEIRLIYYRDCQANPGSSFLQPTLTDTLIGLIYSVKKCEYLTFGLWYNASMSFRDATPLCPYNPATTQCDTGIEERSGYRTEVYADTVVLPANTDDWLIGLHYSSRSNTADAARGNDRMNWYTRKYSGVGDQCAPLQTQNPRQVVNPPYLAPVPPGMNPPSPFSCRIQGINTEPQGNDPTESYFYIEARYNNAIDCGKGKIFCANSTPHSAGSPFIFQCRNKPRSYDLGYYDDDEHVLKFYNTSPLKFACFLDPSCGNTGSDGLARSIDSVRFLLGSGCKYDNPLCGTSSYSLDENTGVISFEATGPVGKYKAALRIEEFHPTTGQFLGHVFREFAFTIVDYDECKEDESISNKSYFIANSQHNFINCANVVGATNLIEACPGSNMKFSLKAFSVTSINNAALVITGEMHPDILATGGFITSVYKNNTNTPDTATGTFHWNIPANTRPGIYPIIFQIRDCINGYILSRTVVYKVRVNKTNRINWEFLNFKPTLTQGIISFDGMSGRSYHCGSPITTLYTAVNTELSALYNWRLYEGNSTAGSAVDSGIFNNYFPPFPFPEQGKNYVLELITNQYCNNRDTVLLLSKPAINPTLEVVLKDSCYNTKGTIEVKGLTGSAALTTLFDWQSFGAAYLGTPSYLSNTANVILQKKNNTYLVYLITEDTCLYPLSTGMPLEGIKPRAEFTTDKEYVCPLDTIKVSYTVTTSICSPTIDFSVPVGPIKFATYQGTQSNTAPTPKVFTATASIDRGRTAILYKASELRAQGFRPGLISGISFSIAGINDPTQYNLVDIYMKCTDRFDLQNGTFEDTSTQNLIFTAGSVNLSTGWNDFSVKPFVWDGETNLYFEIWTKCNKPCTGDVPTSPSYDDHLTQYVSIIGQYGNSTTTFDNATIATSNFRHNIRFTYRDLKENNNIQWLNDQNTLIARTGGPGDKVGDPKIVANKPIKYGVEVRNGKCKDTFTIDALVDSNYKITVTPKFAGKCPGDTVHLFGEKRYLIPRPIVLQCGVENLISDSCRAIDTTFRAVLGTNFTSTVANTDGDARHSPFGGVTAAIGNPTTDKRLQLLYPYSELKNNPNMRAGYIREIGFEVDRFFANTNRLLNFAIRLKCAPNTQDSFMDNNMESLSTFEEVFFANDYLPVFGWNRIPLQRDFAWDGKSGIIVDICFDNFVGFSYNAQGVRGSRTNKKKQTLFQSANTTGNVAEQFGCNYVTGVRDTIRPNIEFTICKPTRTPPPIPREVRWAPYSYISNTEIFDPIVYNKFTTKYYTILDYVDTTYGKNKVVCRVRDTMTSAVDRPIVRFDPPIAVACEGQSVTVTAGVLGMNRNLYTYQWDTTQYGKVKADYTSPVQIITPPNEGYHYVTVSSINNPNCYSVDSIYVSIQKLKTMPDIGATALICPGDSVLMSIPEDVGYKKPRWQYNGQIIDTNYSVKVGLAGKYSIIVDSGACTNYSDPRFIVMRKQDTATLANKNAVICEGDSAFLMYTQGDNIANPIWNTGSNKPYIKVNQAGIYFLVKPRDQYGCLMHVRDTALVSVISNPEFKLLDDTICLDKNKPIMLQPVPYDPKATYTWQPDGRKLAYLEVYVPGVYTVTRDLNGCKKEARAIINYDSTGIIDLGKNQAICCDEVLTLDANPNGKKYRGFEWSTGEKSQVIYTKPNSSGVYIVEAIKPNGCKDTGSVFIDSKCGEVKANPENEIIYLGQTNQITGTHLGIRATNIDYKWIASDKINLLDNGKKLSPVAMPKDTGDIEYVLVMTVTDTNYMPPKQPCVENEVVRFKVKPNQMDTVNIFSPDGDGINDYFYPRVIGVVEFREIKIYNRYGQLLHDDAKRPWDGKFNGQYQPSGVYMCYISYELNEPRKDKQIKYDKILLTLLR